MNRSIFSCKLCDTEVQEDWQWLPMGTTKILVHYHCMTQYYDHGNIQMQLFDLEQYLDV